MQSQSGLEFFRQLNALTKVQANANFPTPEGPCKSSACGILSNSDEKFSKKCFGISCPTIPLNGVTSEIVRATVVVVQPKSLVEVEEHTPDILKALEHLLNIKYFLHEQVIHLFQVFVYILHEHKMTLPARECHLAG